MDPSRVLPVQFALSLIGYGIVYWTLLRPRLNALDARTALMILGAPQLFRHLGANLLVEGVVSPEMPAAFAQKTAAGDVLTVVLAMIGMLALYNRWRFAIAATWLFNVVGCADLLLNVVRAAQMNVAPALHAQWYVPAFIVPLMLTAHLASFWTLIARSKELRVPAVS